MNPFRLKSVPIAAIVIGLASLCSVHAAETATSSAAAELASRLSALQQDGASYVRLRMEIKGATSQILQLQIKERLTKNSSEIVYQVLFPKDRKGESVLLKKTGNRPVSGALFTPPSTVRTISDLKEPMFGSDLSYEDVIENFFAWEQQAIVGNEVVDGVNCQILESKPGKADKSTYGSVRSWIDPKRLVPLRVEKYSTSGKLLRRIDTTRVAADGGHQIPADLVVHGTRGDSTTQLDGSRIRHDVTYMDADFTPEGLKEVTPPRSAQ